VFLVDSILYIDLLRARKDPVQALRPWLLHEEVLYCGVIRCEVLRGVVSEKIHERMCDLFEAMTSIDIDNTMWNEAADLAWTLDRRGVVLPLTDLMIACCAMRAGAIVVSSDEHFKLIPNLSVSTALPLI
jgi:predicted nucleic acid-binding protein